MQCDLQRKGVPSGFYSSLVRLTDWCIISNETSYQTITMMKMTNQEQTCFLLILLSASMSDDASASKLVCIKLSGEKNKSIFWL